MGQNWAEALLFICVVAQFFCVTASITSASRMLFAFSRDGAVPGHRLWRQVGRNRVPQLSVVAIVVLSAAIMIPAYWNYLVGYLVGTGIAVIGLYIAFILPVILRFRLGSRFEPGAWTLGKHYKWIDAIAILWVVFIVIIFLLPPYKVERPVDGRVLLGSAQLRAHPRGCRGAAVRRLVPPLGPQVVHGPRRDGHRGGARADGGDEARRLRPSHRESARLAPRGGGAGRRPLHYASSAAVNSGSAAVRCIRSKCSAA